MTIDNALAASRFSDSTSPSTYTAAVCDLNGMLPATITIDPNSPIARAKLNSVPLIKGMASVGSTMRRKMVRPPAPSVAAASSCARSRSSSTGWMVRTTKGKVMKRSAKMMPGGAKITRRPSALSSQPPSALCGPYKMTSITPVTSVGIASGRSTTAFKIALPGKS